MRQEILQQTAQKQCSKVTDILFDVLCIERRLLSLDKVHRFALELCGRFDSLNSQEVVSASSKAAS